MFRFNINWIPILIRTLLFWPYTSKLQLLVSKWANFLHFGIAIKTVTNVRGWQYSCDDCHSNLIILHRRKNFVVVLQRPKQLSGRDQNIYHPVLFRRRTGGRLKYACLGAKTYIFLRIGSKHKGVDQYRDKINN